MKNLSDINLISPSRRNLMKLASVGALGAATGLAACSEAASAVTSTPAAAAATDPDAIAIMSSNENPFGPSPKAMEAMRAGVGNIYRYARPQTVAFAEMIAKREGVAPEQVLVTNGSSPILAAFADYVHVQGGDLVTSALTYEGVPRVAQNIGTNVIQVMTEFVKAGKPVIVARTFSKIYAMAGQRLGYGLMQPEMAITIRKTGRLSDVNYLGLVGGMAALDDTAYYEEMRVKTARGRAKLIAMAKDLGRPIAPDPQGSFIYMDVGMPNGEFAAKMLDKGVKVVGARWSEKPEWTRICIGHDHEIEKCHAAAKAILTSI